MRKFILRLLSMMAAAAPAYCQDKLLQLYAERGDADSQYELGIHYEQGIGIPKDEQEAAKWFRKAADQNHAGAQCHLGKIFVAGNDLPKDDVEEAFKTAIAVLSKSRYRAFIK